MEKNYYGMGVNKYQDILNDIYLSLGEIEEKYGKDARKQYELGVFMHLNKACSNRIIELVEKELNNNSTLNPLDDKIEANEE